MSRILMTALMAGLIGGTLGAGGKVGKVISMFRSISGSSGKVGGGGSIGMIGIVRFTSNPLGTGRSGNWARVTFLGINLNFGSIISSHAWIFDKSMKISGK